MLMMMAMQFHIYVRIVWGVRQVIGGIYETSC